MNAAAGAGQPVSGVRHRRRIPREHAVLDPLQVGFHDADGQREELTKRPALAVDDLGDRQCERLGFGRLVGFARLTAFARRTALAPFNGRGIRFQPRPHDACRRQALLGNAYSANIEASQMASPVTRFHSQMPIVAARVASVMRSMRVSRSRAAFVASVMSRQTPM